MPGDLSPNVHTGDRSSRPSFRVLVRILASVPPRLVPPRLKNPTSFPIPMARYTLWSLLGGRKEEGLTRRLLTCYLTDAGVQSMSLRSLLPPVPVIQNTCTIVPRKFSLILALVSQKYLYSGHALFFTETTTLVPLAYLHVRVFHSVNVIPFSSFM